MHFLTAAALLSSLLVPGANAQLNKLAVAAGKKYFGSATDNDELSDSSYVAILSDNTMFGQITPGNTQKWEYTEPEEDTYSYTEGDVIVDFAKNNSQIVRCHNLVWYEQLPSWVSSGSWTNDTLTAVIQAHIASEVGHYKGECYAWDVVNEALSDSGGYRDDVFYEVMGTSYIPIAFQAAGDADSDAKLYYNDYNIEYAGTKATEAIEIVKLVQAAGAPIHGVGLQGHFIVGETPTLSTLTAALEAFVDLGVEVAYTELDVRFSSLPPTSSGLEQQATDYGNVVSACLAVSDCVGVTVWDFDDEYSWVPSTFSGQGDACLFWSNLTAKPAYYSVSSILAAAATSGSGSTTASSTAAAAATTTASTVASASATTLSTVTKAASSSSSSSSAAVKVTSTAASSSAAATTEAATTSGAKGSTAAVSSSKKTTASSSTAAAATTKAATTQSSSSAAAVTTSAALTSASVKCAAKAKRTVTVYV